MQIKKPVFWSDINIISILLFPFTFIFLCLSSLNNSLKRNIFSKFLQFLLAIFTSAEQEKLHYQFIFKLLKKKVGNQQL